MSNSSNNNNRPKNVEYLLLAEFDIDKGSVLSMQYPHPTGCDEQLIAEQMLPDGAHNQDEDCTFFFLGRAIDADNDSSSNNNDNNDNPHYSHNDKHLDPASPGRALGSPRGSTAGVTKPMEVEVYVYNDDTKNWDPLSTISTADTDNNNNNMDNNNNNMDNNNNNMDNNNNNMDNNNNNMDNNNNNMDNNNNNNMDNNNNNMDNNNNNTDNPPKEVLNFVLPSAPTEDAALPEMVVSGMWGRDLLTIPVTPSIQYHDASSFISQIRHSFPNTNNDEDNNNPNNDEDNNETESFLSLSFPIINNSNDNNDDINNNDDNDNNDDNNNTHDNNNNTDDNDTSHPKRCVGIQFRRQRDRQQMQDWITFALQSYHTSNNTDNNNNTDRNKHEHKHEHEHEHEHAQHNNNTHPVLTTTSPSSHSESFLRCINIVLTRKDDTIRRGASVKALALCSRSPYFFVWRKLVRSSIARIFDEDRHVVISDLYRRINDVDLSATDAMSPLRKRVWRWSIMDHRSLISTIRVPDVNTNTNTRSDPDPEKSKEKEKETPMIRIPVPLALHDDEVDMPNISVRHLIRRFGAATMDIYNAILAEHRVLFLGYNHSAGEVCRHVLAAASLVAPPLRGFLAHRMFPYTSLVNLAFLNVPGYIAGVTNPMFEHRGGWWDILCDIDSGRVKKNPNTFPSDITPEYAEYDQQHIADMIATINAHNMKGVSRQYSEDYIRSKFQTYTRDLLALAYDEGEYADEEAKRTLLQANANRLAHWKMTSTYNRWVADHAVELQSRPVTSFSLERYIRKLRIGSKLSESEIISIFQLFLKHVRNENQLLEFLSYLPESEGGLDPIAFVMFHPSEAVRLAAVAFFRRLDTIKEGSRCINQLNTFLMLTYERNSRTLPKTEPYTA